VQIGHGNLQANINNIHTPIHISQGRHRVVNVLPLQKFRSIFTSSSPRASRHLTLARFPLHARLSFKLVVVRSAARIVYQKSQRPIPNMHKSAPRSWATLKVDPRVEKDTLERSRLLSQATDLKNLATRQLVQFLA